jgi:hypothetical protein
MSLLISAAFTPSATLHSSVYLFASESSLPVNNSPIATWALQVPFITKPGFALKETRTATLAGVRLELRPAAFGYTNIVVSSLSSEIRARDLFNAMRISLFVASLNASWGIRVQGEALTLDLDAPLPNRVDVPLIYPEGKDLSRLAASHGPIGIQIDKVWQKFLGGIAFGLESKAARAVMSEERVKLAFELYVDSYFEFSDTARFLGFVGVLEVLKDNQTRSDAALGLVRKWKAEASDTLDISEADSIRGSLEWLNSISIAQGIASVVSRHLGDDRAREARSLYTMRSELVHDGKRLVDASKIVRVAEQIVTELLADIVKSGSR